MLLKVEPLSVVVANYFDDNLENNIMTLPNFRAELQVPEPNFDFKNFKGKITLQHYTVSKSFERGNMLLRGAKLVGTEWAIGCVIYTSTECKI